VISSRKVALLNQAEAAISGPIREAIIAYAYGEATDRSQAKVKEAFDAVVANDNTLQPLVDKKYLSAAAITSPFGYKYKAAIDKTNKIVKIAYDPSGKDPITPTIGSAAGGTSTGNAPADDKTVTVELDFSYSL
jgi:hypothetical protein